MKYTEARQGRVFILRLEEGDVVHECIEVFARDHGVTHGLCFYVGGADKTSNIVVGPEDPDTSPIVPVTHLIGDIHEMLGVGTLAPNEAGEVILHMHAAFGNGGKAKAGCIRAGVDTWLVGEVILLELVDTTAIRRKDDRSGFALLEVE